MFRDFSVFFQKSKRFGKNYTSADQYRYKLVKMSIDSDMSQSKNTFKENQIQAKIRFLLCLWDLGAVDKEVKRGVLNKRIVRKHEKSTDYEKIISELEKEGAIAISKNSFSLVSPKSLEVLGEGLKSPDFRFEGTIVGTWAANALLKWISESNNAVVAPSISVNSNGNGNGKKAGIKSYDEFKKITLDVYEQLNRDYNLDNLVPIYRIRRTVGGIVTREQFNEWLLEMQANDILQLQGGSLPDNDPIKLEDSVTTEVSGLRCYAKLLN